MPERATEETETRVDRGGESNQVHKGENIMTQRLQVHPGNYYNLVVPVLSQRFSITEASPIYIFTCIIFLDVF